MKRNLLKWIFADEWDKLSAELWYAEYELRNRIEKENEYFKIMLAAQALGALNDFNGEKLSLAIKVETDNSGCIKILIGEMEHSAIRKLLDEAKKVLLEKLK